mmetsp:Transcript_32070/g.73718  ORF Transcript_32070/g.73718 Transcript_32070/m.73718 type:complete len:332 (+) Transcript_32070:1056-2051(+)
MQTHSRSSKCNQRPFSSRTVLFSWVLHNVVHRLFPYILRSGAKWIGVAKLASSESESLVTEPENLFAQVKTKSYVKPERCSASPQIGTLSTRERTLMLLNCKSPTITTTRLVTSNSSTRPYGPRSGFRLCRLQTRTIQPQPGRRRHHSEGQTKINIPRQSCDLASDCDLASHQVPSSRRGPKQHAIVNWKNCSHPRMPLCSHSPEAQCHSRSDSCQGAKTYRSQFLGTCTKAPFTNLATLPRWCHRNIIPPCRPAHLQHSNQLVTKLQVWYLDSILLWHVVSNVVPCRARTAGCPSGMIPHLHCHRLEVWCEEVRCTHCTDKDSERSINKW